MKKATLLIQHLENIYTMVPSYFSCVSHGFIAIHHDEILALGEGEGWDYVDKDTRIIEGRSHIAIPGLIDVACALPKLDDEKEAQKALLELYMQSECMMQHGTLIINCTKPKNAKHLLEVIEPGAYLDIMDTLIKQGYKIISPLISSNGNAKRFCISCGYPKVNCLDQWLCAKLYANAHPEIDACHILAACTITCAKALGLKNVGMLKPKAKANILLLEGESIAYALSLFHGDSQMQVIKDGVRRYPHLLI